MSATIKICNLSKNFDQISAVKNISFQTQKGEIIALLGPNGAGKSTLMNMITGYLSPSEGKIEILGQDISQSPLTAKEVIGFLPEGAPMYPDLSVHQFLNYMCELRGFFATEKARKIAEISALAKIENVLEQKIETLSKGYLRRVGFAQSILTDPPILLLDEPTDGLDPNQKEHICALIKQMGKDKTILISTHLLEEAQNLCNRIIIMQQGQIMADGKLTDILAKEKLSTLEEVFKKLTNTDKAK